MAYYKSLWKQRKQVFEPTTTSTLRKLLYRLANLWRIPPVCLACGREKGYWRGADPVCYKCDLT